VSPLRRGGNYAALQSVISVCFCDFEFAAADPRATLHYELTEPTSDGLSGGFWKRWLRLRPKQS
jgi:hypothetical protein